MFQICFLWYESTMEKKSTPILFFLEYDDQNEENFKWYLGIDVEGGRLGEPPQLAARRSKQYDRGTNFFEKKNPKKKNHLLQLPLLQGARCLRKRRCMAVLMDL